MSDFTDEKVGYWAQSLADELTPEEKIRVWNRIKQHGDSPTLAHPRTWRMTRSPSYGATAGAIIAGLVIALFIAGGVFHPRSGIDLHFREGVGTTAGTSEPSFIVTHLNVIYIVLSLFLFAVCVWWIIRLFVPAHGTGVLGRFSVVKAGGKRKWLVTILVVIGLAVSSLEVVDQYQGGPLGRQYPPGDIEGLTMRAGQSMLLIPIPLTDRTFLPIHVISVQATSDVRGLRILGGIVKNPPILAGIIAPTAAEQKFVPGTVTIPSESHSVAGNHFVPVFKVTGTKPGHYVIDGFTVIYRWGFVVYRTKLTLMVWHLTVK